MPGSESMANLAEPLVRIKAANVQTRKTTAVRLIAVTSHNIKSSNDMRRPLSLLQRDASHTGTCGLYDIKHIIQAKERHRPRSLIRGLPECGYRKNTHPKFTSHNVQVKL
jgi:hypothetical protein